MINITDAAKEDAITPIWRQAFRPFFLGGALFSLLAILLWSLFLSGKLVFTPYGNPVFWHSHEMLFGFVCAIIVGFLLTAVQNWTGLRATNGVPLMMIFLLWLAARVLMATNLVPNPMLIAALDVAFLPACALLMAKLVIKAGNKRNLFFVPVLLLLAAFNGLSHAGVVLGNAEWVNWSHRSVVFLIVAIITVVAGRVIPMFSANGTGTQRVAPTPRLDRALLASTWVIALLFVTNQYDKLPVMLVTALFVVSAVSTPGESRSLAPFCYVWCSSGVVIAPCILVHPRGFCALQRTLCLWTNRLLDGATRPYRRRHGQHDTGNDRQSFPRSFWPPARYPWLH